jgi:hypothetical protein
VSSSATLTFTLASTCDAAEQSQSCDATVGVNVEPNMRRCFGLQIVPAMLLVSFKSSLRHQ